MQTVITFVGFILFVAIYSYIKLRKEKLSSSEGYFLGGRSLTGIVIAGSMLLTNISTEHLIGMNGSSYKNGFIVIAWEVTSAIALVAAAIYFVPKYFIIIFVADFDLVYIAGFSIAAELLPATQASAVYLVMTKEMKLRNCEMRDALPGARAAS